MKKSYLLLLILVFTVFSFALVDVSSNQSIFAEEQTTKNITDVITDDNLSDTIELNNGTTYLYSQSIDGFTGVLNGNGATIKFDGAGVCTPLFNVLNGATVNNLSFSFQQELTFSAKTTQSVGVLANVLTNANVYGIQFENINLILDDDGDTNTLATLNVGLVAGSVSGGSVHQIKINNCKITSKDNGIRPNFNIGLLAGHISDGAVLKNNLITNNQIAVTVAQSTSESFNVGGVVGELYSGTISNNIVEFLSENTITVNFERLEIFLNSGYLVGKVSSMVKIYNNIINADAIILPEVEETNVNTGLVIGCMDLLLEKNNMYGIAVTYDDKLVGNLTKLAVANTFDGLYNITQGQINTYFSASANWKIDGYAWDTEYIWHKTNTSYLPTLQIFEKYSIAFSSSDSVNTLVENGVPIENLPSLTEGDIVTSELSSTEVRYGSSLTITATITNMDNFDKFFYITGLKLNGEEIYNTLEGSKNGYTVLVDDELSEQPTTVTFEVKNFKANNMGTYAVQLGRKTYKLKLKVYQIQNEVDEEPIIPGKIKNTNATIAEPELEVNMQYGLKYVYETANVDSDYSKDAIWYLTYYNPSNADADINSFDIEDKTGYLTSKKISWTFDENCELCGVGSLNIDEYDENEKIFCIYAGFSRDVNDVKIKFEFDDGTEIQGKIAEVVIDNNQIDYKDNENCYITKIRYGNIEHTITLRQLSTDYTFAYWSLNTKLDGAGNGDDYASKFTIESASDDEIIIKAVFTKTNQYQSDSLLWLWITLGGVGVAGIIVAIIIIKKKKSVDTSYKKYMY